MSNTMVDRNHVPLPALTQDGAELPVELNPLKLHLATVRTALDDFEAKAMRIKVDANLSEAGKREQLAALGKTALEAPRAHQKAIELIRARADEQYANALRRAVSAVDSTRALVVAQRIGGLEKSARLRVIGAALTSGDAEALATLFTAPSQLGIFAGLDSRLVEHVRDRLLDITSPTLRADTERTDVALSRSKLAREVLERRIKEIAGVAPAHDRIHTRVNA